MWELLVLGAGLAALCKSDKCPKCNGSGEMEHHWAESSNMVTCDICHGTGKAKFVKEVNGTKYYKSVS